MKAEFSIFKLFFPKTYKIPLNKKINTRSAKKKNFQKLFCECFFSPLDSFSNLCKSRITRRMKWNVLVWKMMLQREVTQFGETPDYRGRCHLIQLTRFSHIYQLKPNTVFDESVDAGTGLQTFPHWPVFKGNNVLVSWFQVTRLWKMLKILSAHWFLFLLSLPVRDGDNFMDPTGCLATVFCKAMLLTC